uniref:Uncharacterized protein n=1 Tax=Oryza rufipogon TaxID=4529 RepID=A0A0E0P592_ORYRU
MPDPLRRRRIYACGAERQPDLLGRKAVEDEGEPPRLVPAHFAFSSAAAPHEVVEPAKPATAAPQPCPHPQRVPQPHRPHDMRGERRKKMEKEGDGWKT